MIWAPLGFNYGHQGTPLNYTQVDEDFEALKNLGVTRLRIVMPNFDSTVNAPVFQNLAIHAKSAGFYVCWGVSMGKSFGNVARFQAFLASLPGYASWAETHRIDEFILGNEEEIHHDNSYTDADLWQGIQDAIAPCRANYDGIISYNTNYVEGLASWVPRGIGALDKLGFNVYGSLAGFKASIDAIQNTFGSKGYVSEFNSPQGFQNFWSETAYQRGFIERLLYMKSAGISEGYAFCFRDGGFGTLANAWAVRTTDNRWRSVWAALHGHRTWHHEGAQISVVRPATPARDAVSSRPATPNRQATIINS